MAFYLFIMFSTLWWIHRNKTTLRRRQYIYINNKLLISHASITWLILWVIQILSIVFWFSLIMNTIYKLSVLLKWVKPSQYIEQLLPQKKYEKTTISSVELRYFKIPLHWRGPLSLFFSLISNKKNLLMSKNVIHFKAPDFNYFPTFFQVNCGRQSAFLS